MAATSTVEAQTPDLAQMQLPTPTSGDGAPGDNFGIALAVENDTVVVGAYGDAIVAPGATFGVTEGSAYVFKRDGAGWRQTQKLVPLPLGEDADNFGASLAMSEEFLAIGAPRRRDGVALESGMVFVYGLSSDGYLLRQLIKPEVAETDQRFGTAIALWQGWMAISVPRIGAGRVDLYRRQADGEYVFDASLSPAGGIADDRFGTALAMADGTLLIGAPNVDGGGAVYRSELSGTAWSTAVRLPLTASSGAELGAAIALHDGLALIGAPGSQAGEVRVLSVSAGAAEIAALVGPDARTGDRFGSALILDETRALIAAGAALLGEGSVMVYRRNSATLTLLTQLDIDDGGTSSRFGVSLALAADGALIGADLDPVGPNGGQGSVRWYLTQPGGAIAAGQLDSGDGAMFDRYGSSVAIDGDNAIVGAFLEDTLAGADAGRAHTFARNGDQWSYGGPLDAPDAASERRYAASIDIDGDYAVIGAYWDVIADNVDQGSAYIYRRESGKWVFDTKLIASDGRARDLFGFAVSILGDRVLVGARGAARPFIDQGKAYVFVRTGAVWSEEAQLDTPEADAFQYFGASVALTSDRAVIGAPGFDKEPGPPSAGAVFVFSLESGQWVPLVGLQAPVPRANAAFGFSLAANSQHVLIGAFQDGTAAQGAAFVYRASDLVLDGELRAAVPQAGEGLGISVAIEGVLAALGGSGFDVGNASNQGSVRVFRRTAAGWVESSQWLAADGAAGDAFGRVVALDRANLLVGAPGRGDDNPLEGTAYVVRLDELFADGFE